MMHQSGASEEKSRHTAEKAPWLCFPLALILTAATAVVAAVVTVTVQSAVHAVQPHGARVYGLWWPLFRWRGAHLLELLFESREFGEHGAAFGGDGRRGSAACCR